MKNELNREYVPPKQIVAVSGKISNSSAILKNRSDQIFTKENNYLVSNGKGYIIIDFGKEICGGIRILNFYKEKQKPCSKIRLRFGESVGETCAELGEKNSVNAHSVRDFETYLPSLSDQEWGDTGFRFVRIDFLEDDFEYRIVNVYAVSLSRKLDCVGSFSCDDKLVNDIFETAKYTVSVTMQKNLWEGIKRDRLIWIGDMQPQAQSIVDLFGNSSLIENAIEMSIDKNPLPIWFGNIPTYSAWLIQIVYDYFLKTGNRSFALKILPYIEGVIDQINQCVTSSGDIDYSLINIDARNGYFLDWPTFGTVDAKYSNGFVFIYTLQNMKKLYALLGLPINPLCDIIINRLKLVKDFDVNAKQVVALGFLAGQIDKDEAKNKLTLNGAQGLSTFMSYFILKAIADSADTNTALSIMKEYYGGMLSRGATTFWEDFDVNWLKDSGRIDEPTPIGKLDLHGDFGQFCYKGFRHSLCHGWSCGPVHFLLEEVLGVKVLDSGCSKIQISPELGNLKWCEGSFATPYGKVKISHVVENGKIRTSVEAPSKVQIVSL